MKDHVIFLLWSVSQKTGAFHCLIDDVIFLSWSVSQNVIFLLWSVSQKTGAYHRLKDDVPEDVKSRRHEELARVFREEAEVLNQSQIGSQHIVLVEGVRVICFTYKRGGTLYKTRPPEKRA